MLVIFVDFRIQDGSTFGRYRSTKSGCCGGDLAENAKRWFVVVVGWCLPSLKLTAKAPENRPSQEETIVFQPSILGAFAVSFREGSCCFVGGYGWDVDVEMFFFLKMSLLKPSLIPAVFGICFVNDLPGVFCRRTWQLDRILFEVFPPQGADIDSSCKSARPSGTCQWNFQGPPIKTPLW